MAGVTEMYERNDFPAGGRMIELPSDVAGIRRLRIFFDGNDKEGRTFSVNADRFEEYVKLFASGLEMPRSAAGDNALLVDKSEEAEKEMLGGSPSRDVGKDNDDASSQHSGLFVGTEGTLPGTPTPLADDNDREHEDDNTPASNFQLALHAKHDSAKIELNSKISRYFSMDGTEENAPPPMESMDMDTDPVGDYSNPNSAYRQFRDADDDFDPDYTVSDIYSPNADIDSEGHVEAVPEKEKRKSAPIRRKNGPPNVNKGSGFHVPGGFKKPSRASGFDMDATLGGRIQKKPAVKPGTKLAPLTGRVGEASLLKRNLTREGEEGMNKRALGANDPENIQIVNLYDNEKLTWVKIAEVLNAQRVATGRAPTFTPNCVHNRYNRNGPLLYAAEGRRFIPIKQRTSDMVTESMWTADVDKILVQSVKDVEARKWAQVAELVSERTGQDIGASACAHRFKLL